MAVALAASYPVYSTTPGQTTTTPSFTPATGEVLIIKAVGEDFNNLKAGTPTATGGGITWRQSTVGTVSNNTYGTIWSGTVTAGGSAITVSMPWNMPAARHSMVVERWTGAQLAATPATVHVTGTGAPLTTITTTAAGSVVSWQVGDWAAKSPTGRAYNTTSATPTEDGLDNGSPNNYVAYFAYQAAASAGSQTIGLTAPTGQTWQLLAIEIQAAGGSTPATVVAAAFAASVYMPVPTVTGGVATVPGTVLVPPFTASASLPAPTALGAVAGTVNAPAFTASAAMPVPAVAGAKSAVVVAPAMGSSASMPTPIVTALKAALVAAPPFTANADLQDPTVSAGGSGMVAAPPMTASASLPIAAVVARRAAAVIASAFTATAQLLQPSIRADSGAYVQAPTMGATASLPTPTVIGRITALVVAPRFTATASMPTPSVGATTAGLVVAPPLVASAQLEPPTLRVGVSITVPVFAATASLLTPVVLNGGPPAPPPVIEATFLPRSDGLAVSFIPINREWTGFL